MTSFVQRLTESCSNKQTKCKWTSSQTNRVKVQQVFPSPTGYRRQMQAKWLPLHPKEKPKRRGVEGSSGWTCWSALPYSGVHRLAEVCPQLVPPAREARGTQVPASARDSPSESRGRGDWPWTLSPKLLCSRWRSPRFKRQDVKESHFIQKASKTRTWQTIVPKKHHPSAWNSSFYYVSRRGKEEGGWSQKMPDFCRYLREVVFTSLSSISSSMHMGRWSCRACKSETA